MRRQFRWEKNDGYRRNSLSRVVLPDRNCDIFSAAQADPEVRFSSLKSPRRARRHLVYPTASNWPEFSATARKKIKDIKSLRISRATSAAADPDCRPSHVSHIIQTFFKVFIAERQYCNKMSNSFSLKFRLIIFFLFT